MQVWTTARTHSKVKKMDLAMDMSRWSKARLLMMWMMIWHVACYARVCVWCRVVVLDMRIAKSAT